MALAIYCNDEDTHEEEGHSREETGLCDAKEDTGNEQVMEVANESHPNHDSSPCDPKKHKNQLSDSRRRLERHA